MDKMNILIVGTSSIFAKRLISALESKKNYNTFLKKHNIEDIFDKSGKYYSINSIDIDILINISTLKKGLDSEIYYSNIIYPLRIIEKLNSNLLIINIDTTAYEYRYNSYSHSKKVFKDLLKIKKCKSINLRIEHIYGYYPSENITSYLIKKMIKNQDIDLSSGEQIRNFIYIDDAVSAIIRCIENINQLNYNSTIDIASDDYISIKKLANLIKKLIASKSTLNFDRIIIDKNEFKPITFNNTILKRLEWEQKIGLVDGIKKEIDEVRNEIFKR
ncbi:hypothetical protein CP962_03605 [Arcobacter ellisii]|uniref:NAD-dependent epimerase/dehydratase domain-containing protein n=2 Tax=Arcobacter ellisii TaxID=913109 RepID=A0AA94F8Q3_9BACT|nr:hypothetical protein CP962_03605 [Arcobacter ellisii]